MAATLFNQRSEFSYDDKQTYLEMFASLTVNYLIRWS